MSSVIAPEEDLEFVACIDIEEEQDANAKLNEFCTDIAGDNATKSKELEKNMA